MHRAHGLSRPRPLVTQPFQTFPRHKVYTSKYVFVYLPTIMHDVITISANDTDYYCGIMMAHYFHHLTLVNLQFFTCIAIIYKRYTNDHTNNYWNDYWCCGDADKQSILATILMPTYLILNWLCIRYHYQLPFNLLLHNIAQVIDPINFFCSFIRPGNG